MRILIPCIVVFLFVLPGCQSQVEDDSPKPGAPPLEFSFRKSQIPLRGVVAGIRNASTAETLEEFVVRVEAPEEEGIRSYRVEVPLKPEDSITVGWVELDGWALKPGQTLSVSCEQYTEPATVVVPKR